MNETAKKSETNYAYYAFLVSLMTAVWVLGGLFILIHNSRDCPYFVPMKNHPHVLACRTTP